MSGNRRQLWLQDTGRRDRAPRVPWCFVLFEDNEVEDPGQWPLPGMKLWRKDPPGNLELLEKLDLPAPVPLRTGKAA